MELWLKPLKDSDGIAEARLRARGSAMTNAAKINASSRTALADHRLFIQITLLRDEEIFLTQFLLDYSSKGSAVAYDYRKSTA